MASKDHSTVLQFSVDFGLLMVGGALLMVGGAEVEVERYGRLSAELAPSTSRDTNCSLRQTHTSS